LIDSDPINIKGPVLARAKYNDISLLVNNAEGPDWSLGACAGDLGRVGKGIRGIALDD
jgi:hypothetical protein